MDFQINSKKLWETTIASSKVTLGLLSAFEGNGYNLIEEVIGPLKKLIENGGNLQQLEQNQRTSSIIPEPITLKLPLTNTPVRTHRPYTVQRHDAMEPNWERIDQNTIRVHLGNGKYITSIAVTTEAQLETIIPEIRGSDFITIDCEFLGMKKEMPILKLLQIAVSKEKGYAIQVDLVGLEGITRHLKPVLEDTSVNQIGWAYRGDAMAIECYLKDIDMAPVLDLQAKLKPIAVEELSLGSAVDRYAKDWEGYNDFMTIKQFRDNFSFSAHDCIWTKTPLPAKALVYSIFDVVCLFALAEAVSQYPNSEQHYWPLTITHGSNPKALNRWQTQRAIGKNSSHPSPIASTSPPESARPTNRKKKHFPPAPEFYDDNDPQFQKDMQDALKRSKQEYISSVGKQDGASGSNSHIDEEKNGLGENNWHEEEEEQDVSIYESEDDWRKDLDDSDNVVHFTKENKVPSPTITVSSGNWGVREEHSTSENNLFRSWPYERNTKNSTPTPRNDDKPLPVSQSISPSRSFSPRNTFASPKSRNIRSPNVSNSHFQAKPERDRYSADLKNRSSGDQSGKFSWGSHKPQEMAEESWSRFAIESGNLWQKGKDADLKDISSKPVVSASAPVTPQVNKAKKTFNTLVNNFNINQSESNDNWDTIDEQPRTMEMQMNQVPIRHNFSGPKVVNPYDDEFDDDDDDDDDDEEDDEVTKKNDKSSIPEDSPTLADDIYLTEAPYYLSVHKITAFEHLNLINIPTQPYVAAITYHVVGERREMAIKALQIYIATEDKGDSYTVVLDQACLLKDRNRIAGTKFGYLLTHPDVKRVTWFISFVQEKVKEKLNFYIGPSTDVSFMVAADLGKEQSFHNAAGHYLRQWSDWEKYYEQKTNQDKAANKSFGYAPWDEKKLRDAVLEHSAFCGLVLYKLYKYPKSIDHVDEKEFAA
ncbi:hypothetical protein G6F56_006899 [Rhizopus delemar]|nr:hypothetical protein G6F56_006899 [Rhizopus delemar]